MLTGGECQVCGHVDLVHRDGGSQRCLYNACPCKRFDGPRLATREPPAVVPLTLPIIARKGLSTITGALAPREARARAEELSQAGWSVYVGSSHVSPTEDA